MALVLPFFKANSYPRFGLNSKKRMSKHKVFISYHHANDQFYKDYLENFNNDYDIFISTGGPGNPHSEGFQWEKKFSDFLQGIWDHNKNSEQKKFLFLICHSFQLATIHFGIGNICKRKSYSFGVMPMHKTFQGEEEILFKNLPEPFYAVDARDYQFIEPNHKKITELGMKITALEKIRPHINLERAVMAVRFSEEIFGTQFHPEANAEGMLQSMQTEYHKSPAGKAPG